MIIGYLIDRKRLQVSKNNFLFAMRRYKDRPLIATRHSTSLLRPPAKGRILLLVAIG